MKIKDLELIDKDNRWVKISFKSNYSTGEILIKYSVYELKQRYITKVFKDCEISILPNYLLSFEETLKFNKEIISMKKQISSLYHSLDYAIRINDKNYISQLHDRINETNLNLVKLVNELKHLYYWKEECERLEKLKKGGKDHT